MAAILTDTLRIAVAQLDSVVGDVEANLARARAARAEAAASGADLLLLPELFIGGYPPEDLVLKPAFPDACRRAVEALAADTADGGPGVVIGVPWPDDGKVYNAVALLDAGKVVGLRYKVELPNYGVFDELRVFTVGPLPGPIAFRGIRLGLPICEDIWFEQVAECLMETGAEILVVPNGSPYWQGKADVRQQVALARVVETGLPMVYCNQCGGQDELVFDGGSFGLHGDHSLAFQMPQFEEAIATVTWSRKETGAWRCIDGPMASLPGPRRGELARLRRGSARLRRQERLPRRRPRPVRRHRLSRLRRHGRRCAGAGARPLRHAALPLHLQREPERCRRARRSGSACVTTSCPSPPPSKALREALKPVFAGRPPGVAEENLQARTRGTMLMAISNKFGSMLVTTGNKSEVSVGYATLYGDMNGGFNPIKDLYKTEVYKLARWRNAHRPPGALGPEGEVIPPNVITRAPTAELRENQTDQDSLPPYNALDDILECLVEGDMRIAEVVERGHDEATVRRVEKMLYAAEYKRRQAAPGVKITRKNFGRDRRYPITNRFRDRD